MRKYIVTPWKDDEELLMVRRLLFGGRPISVGERYFTTDQCSQAINLVGSDFLIQLSGTSRYISDSQVRICTEL